MFLVRASYNVGAYTTKKTVDFNVKVYGYPFRAFMRRTARPRQAAVDAVAGIVSPLFSVTAEDIKLDEALLAPKASATIATLMGDGVIPVAAGPQATTADDGSASTSAASVEPAAAETEEMVSVSPRVFLPAPTQAVTIDKEAERAELVRQMEDAWPARCQVANERLITTLQTKLGAAENKISDLENDKTTLKTALTDVITENASLKQQVKMLRDVLSSRTNTISTATQPATTAEGSASRVPGVSPTEDGRSSLTAASKTKDGVTARSANQRWTKDQENVRSASGSKKSGGSAWRPPRPSSNSAVTPTVTTAKKQKPAVRRAWSWADEADLSEDEQKRLLDQYFRDNPDPFNEGRR